MLRREPAARLLVGMMGAELAALGMLDVLYVVLALGVLDIGQSGAGYLNAAFGLGGALAIAVTVSLVGRRRLMPPLLGALGAWTAGIRAAGRLADRRHRVARARGGGRRPRPLRRRGADAAPAHGARRGPGAGLRGAGGPGIAALAVGLPPRLPRSSPSAAAAPRSWASG